MDIRRYAADDSRPRSPPRAADHPVRQLQEQSATGKNPAIRRPATWARCSTARPRTAAWKPFSATSPRAAPPRPQRFHADRSEQHLPAGAASHRGRQPSNDAPARGHRPADRRVDQRLAEIVNTRTTAATSSPARPPQTPPFVITKNPDGIHQRRPTRALISATASSSAASKRLSTLYPALKSSRARPRRLPFDLGRSAPRPERAPTAATDAAPSSCSTSTTFAAGSGVQAGTSSAARDTIIGPAGAYQLTINDTSGTGASGTVSLNGGLAVAFSNTDTDLVVTGPKGELIHLDTTAITPTFNGTVAVTANGTLSVDGGATTVPITFAANQQLTNSLDGSVTNVNSVNIRTTGTDQLDYTGSADAFQALIELRDDLRNKRGLSEPQQIEAISGQVAELDRVSTNILTTVGEQSAGLENLDNLESHLQDLQLTTKKLISNLEDVDISQVVLQLQSQQNLLQLTLGATARLMSVSLLDFLH